MVDLVDVDPIALNDIRSRPDRPHDGRGTEDQGQPRSAAIVNSDQSGDGNHRGAVGFDDAANAEFWMLPHTEITTRQVPQTGMAPAD